jgi:Fe-S oxidoreductase
MLDLAKRMLLQDIDALRPAIRAGIPVVGLEPSCLSVFRDELKNMLPDDEDAQRLAWQTKTISELLLTTSGWKAPRLTTKALVQTHCHHKAVLDAETQQLMFQAMGLELRTNRPDDAAMPAHSDLRASTIRCRWLLASRPCSRRCAMPAINR